MYTFWVCAPGAQKKEVPLNPAAHISIANFLLFTILFIALVTMMMLLLLFSPPSSSVKRKKTPNWVVANGKYTKEDERHEGGMNEVKTTQIFLSFFSLVQHIFYCVANGIGCNCRFTSRI